MVSTRSSTKQMITRTKSSGKTQFMELPQRKQRKRNVCVHADITTTESSRSTVQSVEFTSSTQSSTCVETDDSEYIYDSESFNSDESDLVSVLTTDSFLDNIENREYEVAIDFDDAHDSWMSNKKRNASGAYVYICGYVKPNHKLCRIACCDKIGIYSGCKKHYMWEEKIHKGCFE